MAETDQLRQRYCGTMSVLRGIELDYYSLPPVHPYDYRLGSVHYVKFGDSIVSVDSDPRQLEEAVAQLCGGNWSKLYRL